MVTSAAHHPSLHRLIDARILRDARRYAPDSVVAALHDASTAPDLVLVLDCDTLERSALAKVDRVMVLALAALARAGVDVVLAATYERDRAELLGAGIAGSRCIQGGAHAVPLAAAARTPRPTVIAISDDPALLGSLGARDRGLALGRPELADASIVSIGDTAVRAALWWLLGERTRHLLM